MYRTIAEFLADWSYESAATLKFIRALSDASLGQRITDDHRTLGRIAWHLAQTLPEMGGKAGLPVTGPAESAGVPARATEIAAQYEAAAASLAEAVQRTWSDAQLPEEIEMYGEHWSRGRTLAVFIKHQAHHRGQMSVLMRQAGLRVPDVYGPTKEDWAQWGMQAQV